MTGEKFENDDAEKSRKGLVRRVGIFSEPRPAKAELSS
jgi:hypothetical protein